MKVLVIVFLFLSAAFGCSFGQNEKPIPSSTFEQKTIRTSDGVDLLVRIKGSGPPCLFVHGGPGTGCHWIEKISDGLLERHFRMIYLDQRGAERSSSPQDGNYSMEREIEDFEQVRKELGIERWLTMGHSFGGLLQTGYALRHPEVQKGMIMLNCSLDLNASLTGNWIPKACELLGVTDPDSFFSGRVSTLERLQKLVVALQERGIFWKMGFASPEAADSVDNCAGDIPDRNVDAQKGMFETRDYWENFKPVSTGIETPVLFISGRSDWMAGPDNYKGVKFPNMLLWESQVGHTILLENRPDLEKALDTFTAKYKF